MTTIIDRPTLTPCDRPGPRQGWKDGKLDVRFGQALQIRPHPHIVAEHPTKGRVKRHLLRPSTPDDQQRNPPFTKHAVGTQRNTGQSRQQKVCQCAGREAPCLLEHGALRYPHDVRHPSEFSLPGTCQYLFALTTREKYAQFQLRYCPALAKKPTSSSQQLSDGPEKKENKKKKKFNPFENPDRELVVAEIPAASPTHVLVLNKFPVIQDHFILATKAYKEQTHKLDEDDVFLTHQCLKAWESDVGGSPSLSRRRLYAFFNSGEHSGASQPHRHIQFIPVESMRRQERRGSSDWKMLIDLAAAETVDHQGSAGFASQHRVPFALYVKKLPRNVSSEQLYEAYNELYDAALATVMRYVKDSGDESVLFHSDAGALPISYNLAMTTEAMAICPRRCEGTTLKDSGDVQTDMVALNGTLLSGSLMVKGKVEWELLKESSKALDSVLEAIGIPSQYQ